MTISIRRYAKDDDIDEIFTIHDEALQAIGCTPLGRDRHGDLNHIMEHYVERGGDFLMVEAEGRVIGFGALQFISDGLYEIKRMRIRKEWQGRGIGKILLRKLLDIAGERGFDRIILDTTAQQHAAQRLYERFGFRRYGTRHGEGLDLILYEYAKPAPQRDAPDPASPAR